MDRLPDALSYWANPVFLRLKLCDEKALSDADARPFVQPDDQGFDVQTIGLFELPPPDAVIFLMVCAA